MGGILPPAFTRVESSPPSSTTGRLRFVPGGRWPPTLFGLFELSRYELRYLEAMELTAMEALDPDPFDETSDAVCEDERALALSSRGRNGSLVDRGGPDSEVVMTERSAIAIGPGTVLPSQSSLTVTMGGR